MSETAQARGYADPVRVGVLLGLLLFLTILVAGQGLGASGAFAAGAAATVEAVSPATLANNAYLADRVPVGPRGLLGEWLVLELIGVAIGAWISARLAGRARWAVERTGTEGRANRLGRALVGGALMGAGARLAHGCTSGLALTGGALLSTGAWVFIPVAFAAAFLVAWGLRVTTRAVTA